MLLQRSSLLLLLLCTIAQAKNNHRHDGLLERQDLVGGLVSGVGDIASNVGGIVSSVGNVVSSVVDNIVSQVTEQIPGGSSPPESTQAPVAPSTPPPAPASTTAAPSPPIDAPSPEPTSAPPPEPTPSSPPPAQVTSEKPDGGLLPGIVPELPILSNLPLVPEVTSLVGDIIAPLDPALSLISSVAAPVLTPIESIIAPIESLVESVVSPIAPPIISAIESVAQPIIDPVESLIQSNVAPIITPIASLAESVLNPGLTPIISAIQTIADPILNPIQSAVESVIESQVGPIVGPIITPGVSFIASVVPPIISDVQSIVNPIESGIGSILDPAISQIQSIVDPIITGIPPVVSDIIDQPIVTDIISFVDSAISNLPLDPTELPGIVTNLPSVATSVLAPIQTFLSDFISALPLDPTELPGIVTNLPSVITSVIQVLPTEIQDPIGDILTLLPEPSTPTFTVSFPETVVITPPVVIPTPIENTFSSNLGSPTIPPPILVTPPSTFDNPSFVTSLFGETTTVFVTPPSTDGSPTPTAAPSISGLSSNIIPSSISDVVTDVIEITSAISSTDSSIFTGQNTIISITITSTGPVTPNPTEDSEAPPTVVDTSTGLSLYDFTSAPTASNPTVPAGHSTPPPPSIISEGANEPDATASTTSESSADGTVLPTGNGKPFDTNPSSPPGVPGGDPGSPGGLGSGNGGDENDEDSNDSTPDLPPPAIAGIAAGAGTAALLAIFAIGIVVRRGLTKRGRERLMKEPLTYGVYGRAHSGKKAYPEIAYLYDPEKGSSGSSSMRSLPPPTVSSDDSRFEMSGGLTPFDPLGAAMFMDPRGMAEHHMNERESLMGNTANGYQTQAPAKLSMIQEVARRSGSTTYSELPGDEPGDEEAATIEEARPFKMQQISGQAIFPRENPPAPQQPQQSRGQQLWHERDLQYQHVVQQQARYSRLGNGYQPVRSPPTPQTPHTPSRGLAQMERLQRRESVHDTYAGIGYGYGSIGTQHPNSSERDFVADPRHVNQWL